MAPPLGSTALAPVSTGSILFVYYQAGTSIYEATSRDGGSSWEANPHAIGEGVPSWGAPFTAYYNKQDADHGDKETIHLLYVTIEGKLLELFKYITEDKWETIPSDVIANNGPTATSRMCSGAVQIGPVVHHQVKHQFVYYETFDGKALNFTEIWRAPTSPWKIQTVLPGTADQQPGSDLAAAIRSDYLRLFYQDRTGNIKLWENTTGWKDKGVFIPTTEISRQTPIAATTPSLTSNKDTHIVFASSGQPARVKHCIYDGTAGSDSKTIDAEVQFYPGSHLGLVIHGENVLLFYIDVHSGALRTKKYQASTGWVDGALVVAW